MSDPIVPQDYIAGVTVVDIGDARVARGMTRRPSTTCRHHAMMYDTRERRIWCSDCEQDVHPFDAFTILVEHFSAAEGRIAKMLDEAKSAREASIHLIAAKRMEKAWRRKRSVPACPHCHAGILPEDVERMGAVSREIEIARRRCANPERHDDE